MSVVSANPATRAPTIRVRDSAAHADHDRKSEPSGIWVLLEQSGGRGTLVPSIAFRRGSLCRPFLKDGQDAGDCVGDHGNEEVVVSEGDAQVGASWSLISQELPSRAYR